MVLRIKLSNKLFSLAGLAGERACPVCTLAHPQWRAQSVCSGNQFVVVQEHRAPVRCCWDQTPAQTQLSTGNNLCFEFLQTNSAIKK